MRIALLAVLAFAGIWFVALRPKPAADSTAAPPVQTAPAPAKPANGVLSAPEKAESAVAKANDASTKSEAAATSPSEGAAKPAPTATKPASEKAVAGNNRTAEPAGPAATPDSESSVKTRNETKKVERVLADIKADKVVVMLFWDRRSPDDREVFRAAERTDRHDGKVSVRAAPIQRLGDYDKVTRGLPIANSPSVVVIDRAKRATVISGLTVTEEIDAAVDRALKRK